MPIKILMFGDTGSTKQVLELLKAGAAVTSDDIQVDNLKIQGKNFLVFTVRDLSLVSSQAAGVAGLMYFLGDNSSVYESRQNLFELLNDSRQLDGIPLMVGVQAAGKAVNLKQIISELELFKIKDRATMVKEIDYAQPASVYEVFDWIEAQSGSYSSKVFEAQPRVVKAKPKYREQQKPNEKTYEQLMGDKAFKGLDSVSQEQKYLALEKDRIKQENMQTQLNNFNKNKKKMTPFDIKPITNTRIEPNLNFFLKDSKNEKPQQANIKIQTDQFKPLPPPKKYVPKKTGVDSSTQVGDNELFDFEREVEPILNVLITKTLELSSLEIEQEEEMLKMEKYRQLYNQKRANEKSHQKDQLQAEMERIKHKNEILEKYQNKQATKIACFKKVQAYKIAGAFTTNLYKNTVDLLHKEGFFHNEFQEELQTSYVDFLLAGTMNSLKNLRESRSALQNHFDKTCIDPLLEKSREPKHERLSKKQIVENRRANQVLHDGSHNQNSKRLVHIFYEHKPLYIYNFARYFSKYSDKTLEEYNRGYAERLKQIQNKVALGEVTEDAVVKFKADEMLELTKDQQAFRIPQEKIAFAVGHNQFENTPESDWRVKLNVLAVDKNGELVHDVSTQHKKSVANLTYTNELRDNKKVVNMDEGIVIDLKNAPQEIATYILMLKIPDVASLLKPNNAKALNHAVYGLELYDTGVPVLRESSLQKLKPEELVKPEEEGQVAVPQSCLVAAYVLSKKPEIGGWYLQTVRWTSKGMSDPQVDVFKQDILGFLKTTLPMDKEQNEEEEQEQVREKSGQKKSREDSVRDKRRKSTKAEPVPVVVKKIKVVLAGRCLNPIWIDTQAPFQSIIKSIEDEVNKFPEFTTTCLFGWDLKLKGKQLTSSDMLKKYRQIGDLQLQKKPEVIMETNQSKLNTEEAEKIDDN